MKYLYLILSVLFSLSAGSRTLVVGKGMPFATLKRAIMAAQNGDSIIVKPGVYREGAITITKPISIIGEGFPVLDGEHKYQVLLISGTGSRVSGLRIINSGYSALEDYASIKLIDASRIIIENNVIEGAYFAIHISNSRNVIVRNNKIKGIKTSEQLAGNGIHLWKSADARIEKNYISGHRDGIYFEFVSHSVILQNFSEKNIRYGLHFMFSNDDRYIGNTFLDNGAGVAVMYSKKVSMESNRFEKNWGAAAYGLLLKDITDSYIRNNHFYRNSTALHMEGSSRIDIEKNIFRENGWAIRVQASCDDNRFHHNNFNGNSFDVATNGSLSLNRFYNNYWDKYEGYDINRDGIGDIPYHPVSLYSMIVEQNPNALILYRSFTVQLIDKSERAFPVMTPAQLKDEKPLMKFLKK